VQVDFNQGIIFSFIFENTYKKYFIIDILKLNFSFLLLCRFFLFETRSQSYAAKGQNRGQTGFAKLNNRYSLHLTFRLSPIVPTFGTFLYLNSYLQA
jgi:hypothetical protein